MFKKLIKRIKCKTYWFAGVVGVLLPILETHLPLFRQLLIENHAVLYISLSIGIAFFREITHNSVNDK